MRKTKIVCTLGPSTDQPGILRQLMENGMNVARFNFSHGDYEEHKGRLDALRALETEMDLPIPAMLDTKGPEIRLGTFANTTEKLTTGQKFTLTTRDIPGTNEICSVTYKDLPRDVQPGGRIMLDDGLIELSIDKVEDTEIHCTVKNDGTIKTKKGVNVPGVHLSMPYMSQRDRNDILFGIEQGFDLISASFTRNAQDIMEIRHLLDEHNCTMRIIAKIENQEGIDNIDEILTVADGIMVARGDMGVEIDFAEIPAIQKHLIDRAMSAGKICITATQMLDSMMVNPRPTRAEITDVANAIYDGTGAVMLSGETAAGKYPVEALKAMATIAETTEADSSFDSLVHHAGTHDSHLTISAAVGHAACTTASDIGASAIISASKSGETARLLSRFRPDTQIIACVLDASTRRQMNIYRGVTPLMMDYANSTDELISMSVEAAEKADLIHSGDLVVVTAGVPVGVSGTTNMIKIHMVGDTLLAGVGIGSQNAKGEVCVCRSAAEAAKKFKPGQILVLPFTTNAALPYMREAAGVITEEAGTNSHSAIVGLTLGKAVIVGATNATRTLKDGMRISMDCARGVVQAMPD
ncbi:MAG TPA: pyruvate kinase [Candidatus Gemmiger excrementavium]|uniref:Pyruvate kinase n=1 Tax=Candidatus Gemmiger excrementavium TaxID=2838608 RepID=A0A9D2JHD0_9FIRM|nr:pyruvate kinase [Candidatus Gemmiger excrementavium]